MTDYVTIGGLTARFGELLLIRLTDDASLGVIDEGRVTPAITAICGEIDGYLRDRYPLPLSTVPEELRSYGEDMVLERIYSGKPERETPKDVRDRARDARAWLRDVQKGTANLSIEIAASIDGVESNEMVAARTGTPGAFTSAKLDRF